MARRQSDAGRYAPAHDRASIRPDGISTQGSRGRSSCTTYARIGEDRAWLWYLLEEALAVGVGPVPHEDERQPIMDRQVSLRASVRKPAPGDCRKILAQMRDVQSAAFARYCSTNSLWNNSHAPSRRTTSTSIPGCGY